ncbi:hypothetical protein [Dyella koreensis]|uniref:Uncharacterized protein n=1 Tax=Dyella koreensis TaxID=311235 RepID=A0ABW8K383_9GAMM
MNKHYISAWAIPETTRSGTYLSILTSICMRFATKLVYAAENPSTVALFERSFAFA